MFGSDYLLGYSQGRSSAEDERDTKALVGRLFYGQRPVQVDQSYLDQLHQLVEQFRANSIHNFDKASSFTLKRWTGRERRSNFTAKRFTGEAGRSQRRRMRKLCELTTQRFKPNSPSATPPWLRRRRRLLRSAPLHQTTHEEKCGLQPSSG